MGPKAMHALDFSDTQFKLPTCQGPCETVYLLQYSTWGHHSLAFYRDQQLIEFTYGDWALFALDKRDLLTAITHMLWPTQGALGRKSVSWEPNTPLQPHFTDCIDIVPFAAEKIKVNALYQVLCNAFTEQAAKQVFHPQDAVYFVPFHIPYALWNNCNHVLAHWLRALDGRVTGRLFYQPDLIKGMRPKLNSIA